MHVSDSETETEPDSDHGDHLSESKYNTPSHTNTFEDEMKLDKPCILMLDSLRAHEERKIFRRLKHYLQSEWKARKEIIHKTKNSSTSNVENSENSESNVENSENSESNIENSENSDSDTNKSTSTTHSPMKICESDSSAISVENSSNSIVEDGESKNTTSTCGNEMSQSESSVEMKESEQNELKNQIVCPDFAQMETYAMSSIPRQKNSCDCGVFVIMYFESFMRYVVQLCKDRDNIRSTSHEFSSSNLMSNYISVGQWKKDKFKSITDKHSQFWFNLAGVRKRRIELKKDITTLQNELKDFSESKKQNNSANAEKEEETDDDDEPLEVTQSGLEIMKNDPIAIDDSPSPKRKKSNSVVRKIPPTTPPTTKKKKSSLFLI